MTESVDGLVALEVVESADGPRYDLLLADIVMPGMDGIELARRAADRISGLRRRRTAGQAVGRAAGNQGVVQTFPSVRSGG